jgi:hypothetical protein
VQLEYETVYYCTREEDRRHYELFFRDGRVHRRIDDEPVTTVPEGWIFVLRDDRIYAHEKKTDKPPRCVRPLARRFEVPGVPWIFWGRG